MNSGANPNLPKSLFECIETEQVDELPVESVSSEVIGYDEEEAKRPKKKQRENAFIMMIYDKELGGIRPMQPEESTWFSLYVKNPPVSNSFQKKFRRRFRLPYQQYLELVEDAIEGEWFPSWTSKKDESGKPCSPLELLILGALRHLGTGWTFDECEECTAISQETHRVFFHEFIQIGSTVLSEKHVLTPTIREELMRHQHE